jgi:maltose O-acetyltransferase
MKQSIKSLLGWLGFICPAGNISIYFQLAKGVNFVEPSTVFLGQNVTFDNYTPSHIYIGRDVWITTGSIIISHSWTSRAGHGECGVQAVRKRVVIRDGCFIGAGSLILPGVVLPRGTYVGAGSVVTNGPNGEGRLIAGNPAKVVR